MSVFKDRYTVRAFNPLDPDFLEDVNEDVTYTLTQARAFAETIVACNSNAIATIYDCNFDWADERVGATYDDACLRANGGR